MLEVFKSSPLFVPASAAPDLLELQTDFERGFHAQGISTLRQAYQRVAD